MGFITLYNTNVRIATGILYKNYTLVLYNLRNFTKWRYKVAVSEAKRRANSKYDKEHMDTIGIKYKKEVVQKIKQYAKENNIRLNQLCINSVLYCMENGIEFKNNE